MNTTIFFLVIKGDLYIGPQLKRGPSYPYETNLQIRIIKFHRQTNSSCMHRCFLCDESSCQFTNLRLWQAEDNKGAELVTKKPRASPETMCIDYDCHRVFLAAQLTSSKSVYLNKHEHIEGRSTKRKSTPICQRTPKSRRRTYAQRCYEVEEAMAAG